MIALSSPLHVGIYEDQKCIEKFQTEMQTSEGLPLLFQAILARYTPRRLFFAKGPGSFMSIKIAYIFLKKLSIVHRIPLLASDGFVFNQGRPIKAMRQLYFVKNEQGIQTTLFDTPQEQCFALPLMLEESLFDENSEPLYMLPAV